MRRLEPMRPDRRPNAWQRFRGAPTFDQMAGCRFTKIGQLDEFRVMRCSTCGLTELVRPPTAVRCFLSDQVNRHDETRVLKGAKR